MDPSDVPLDPPVAPLTGLLAPDAPFTTAMAAGVGVDRSALSRMLRQGIVRRLLRGVYVASTVPDSRAVRAAALSHVVAPGRIVVGRTAGWLHGLPAVERRSSGSAPARLEVVTPGRRGPSARDIEEVHGVRVTTALRTVLDLGRTLAPEQALSVLDAALHGGLVHHRDLLAELPRAAGHPGARQLRRLVAMADGRAGSRAESVLRLRWHDARLPTPVPHFAVGPDMWLELAVPVRRYAAVLAGRLLDAELHTLASAGWRVVVLPERRLVDSDPQFVIGHLEREYLQHLLEQVG